jgi:zinc protease
MKFAARTQRYQFPSGLTLLVLENHANPTVSVAGSLKAGAYYNPPDKHGLARTTADMLNKGTIRRSKLEIAEELESVGARVSFRLARGAVAQPGLPRRSRDARRGITRACVSG